MARLNLLTTFEEYLLDRWQCVPTEDEYKRILDIISCNIWQMDGLKGTLPYGKLAKSSQCGIFGPKKNENETPPCVIRDWKDGEVMTYLSMGGSGMKGKGKKKFDFIIGNPPYQEDMEGTSDNPVYNHYMDAVYDLADKVELISPARFLFNAGKTPKEWNRKMLDDPHLKVLHYWTSSDSVFPGTDIKGGVAITYHDRTKIIGPIKYFVPNDILRIILNKVQNASNKSFNSLVNPTEYYKLSQKLNEDYPDLIQNMSKGHEFDLTSNLLDKNPSLFYDFNSDDEDMVRVFGRQNNRRVKKFFKSIYVNPANGTNKFKVIIPESNNSGQFGEMLVKPEIGFPGDITTQTFISIGFFGSQHEAEAVKKYICGKFARFCRRYRNRTSKARATNE